MDKKWVLGIAATLLCAAIIGFARGLVAKDAEHDTKLTELTRDQAVQSTKHDSLSRDVAEIKADGKETQRMVQQLLRRR